jgi:hypothetical protein
MRPVLMALSLLASAASALAVAAMLVLVGGLSYGAWGPTAFGVVLASAPYAGLAALAVGLRRSLVASAVVLAGTLALSYWGVTIYWEGLHPPTFWNRPPGGPLPMNCAPPLVLIIPPIMLVAVGLWATVALAASHIRVGRERHPAGAEAGQPDL